MHWRQKHRTEALTWSQGGVKMAWSKEAAGRTGKADRELFVRPNFMRNGIYWTWGYMCKDKNVDWFLEDKESNRVTAEFKQFAQVESAMAYGP